MATSIFRRRLQNKFIHGFTRVMIVLVRILPDRTSYAMGRWMSLVALTCMGGWRRTGLRNIELFYSADPPPLKRRREILRQSAINLGYHVVEFMRMGYLPVPEVLEMVVEEDGADLLREAVAAGNGVIAYGLHYGNWELSGAYLTNRVHKLHAVAKKQTDDFFTNLAFPWRERLGIGNIYSGDRLSSAILRALKDGKVLGLIADQNGGRRGTFAPFAGIEASTNQGPAALAMRTGAALVLVYCHRIGPGRLRFICRPLSLEGIEGWDRKDGKFTDVALREALTRMNQTIVDVVAQDPTQWLWGHKRWKTRPPGEAPLY